MQEKATRDDFVKVFSSHEGQKVLQHIKEFAFFDSVGFVENARAADFYAGRRSVVTDILNNMKEVKDETIVP